MQQLLDRGIGIRGAERLSGPLVDRESPCPLQETEDPDDVAGVPGLRRLERAHVHLVEPEGVGAVLGDHVVGVDDVAERLRHLGDDLDDRLAGRGLDEAALAALLDLIDRHEALVGTLIRVARDHPLMEELAHRLGGRDETEIEEHLVPEPRVEQVKHRVLGAADVKIDAARVAGRRVVAIGCRAFSCRALAGEHPVALRVGIDEPRLVLRRAVAQVVPAAARPAGHRVGLADDRRIRRKHRRIDARGARGRLHPVHGLCQRRLRSVALDRRIVGKRRKRHRQMRRLNRVMKALLVVDDRERLAPVALSREEPVAKAVVDPLRAETALLEPGDHRGLRRDGREAVDREPRRGARAVDRDTLAARRGVAIEGRAGDLDDLLDRKPERLRELEVALVVGGHRHDRAGAVAHEHVVGGPDRDAGAGRGVDREGAGRAAGLLLRLLSIDVGAVPGRGDVLGELRVVRRGERSLDERMLRRDHHVGRAEDRVGPRGEDLEVLARAVGERKADLRTLASPDPLALQGLRRLGPVDEREVLEQPIGVGGDPEHPLLERHAKHGMPAAFAAPVDHLLVGEHRAELRAPVDGLLAEVRESMAIQMRLPLAARARRPGLRAGRGLDRTILALERRFQFADRPRLPLRRIEPRAVGLEPDPLRPAVVARIDRRELAGPVVGEPEALELSAKGVDRLLGGHLRMDAGGDRVLLGRQAEGVPAHRMQDVESLHPLEAADDVGRGVALGVPDVQARARGIGEHVEAVELRLRRIEDRLAGVGLTEGTVGLGPRLPALLDLVGECAGVAVRMVVGGRLGHGLFGDLKADWKRFRRGELYPHARGRPVATRGLRRELARRAAGPVPGSWEFGGL